MESNEAMFCNIKAMFVNVTHTGSNQEQSAIRSRWLQLTNCECYPVMQGIYVKLNQGNC